MTEPAVIASASYLPRTLIIAAAALAVGLLVAPVALADEYTASSGQVAATLSVDHLGDYEFTDLWLTITRADAAVYDEAVDIDACDEPYCIPTVAVSDDGGLVVRDLDGDGEPEVIVDVFTGGANCCTVSQIMRWDGRHRLPGRGAQLVRRRVPAAGLRRRRAADQYQLHRRRAALRFLRHEADAGRLDDGPYYKNGRAFVRQLDKTLRRWGY